MIKQFFSALSNSTVLNIIKFNWSCDWNYDKWLVSRMPFQNYALIFLLETFEIRA